MEKRTALSPLRTAYKSGGNQSKSIMRSAHVEKIMNEWFRTAILCIILTCGSIESAIGLDQMLRLKTRLTGSFGNPGPFGGFVAVGIAVAAGWLVSNKDAKWRATPLNDKVLFVLSFVSLLLGVLVLPASLSRAGWLAIGAAMLVLAFKELNLKEYCLSHKLIAAMAVVLLTAGCAGAFALKPKSALGRLHIWRIECMAMSKKPLSGFGTGKVLGAYGETQAEFFKEKERKELTIEIAGCPEYAFNEYLKVGVEHGMPAMALSLTVVILLICFLLRRKSATAYGAIAFAVFALFSYPSSLWQFKALALVLLTDGAISLRTNAAFKYFVCLVFLGAALTVTIRKPSPREERFRKIYADGYALHLAKDYIKSNEILKEGAKVSSDPMFHNIIGKNYESLGDYDNAEAEYLHSHYMVPSRLYPFILLMEMKLRQGDEDAALKFGEMAISLPVNHRNANMEELHRRSSACIDSLKIKRLRHESSSSY